MRGLLPNAMSRQAGYQVSIFEETGGGLGAVAHDRSLELFFDRFEVIARFVALINEDPAVRRVLYLHGLEAPARRCYCSTWLPGAVCGCR